MNNYKRILTILFRIVLGTVFIWASFDKIIDPEKFARNISNYHIVPFGFENTIAIILPWLELLIGSGLILGVMVDGSVLISLFLLFLFNILIAQAILRGFNIECGCGLKEGQMVGFGKIFENFLLVIMAFLLFYRDKSFLEFFPKTNLSE